MNKIERHSDEMFSSKADQEKAELDFFEKVLIKYSEARGVVITEEWVDGTGCVRNVRWER